MSLRPSERAESRRGAFKPSVGVDDGRRRRVDQMVSFRESLRGSALEKRRRAAAGAGAGAGAGAEAAPHTPAFRNKLGNIPQMVQDLYSDDSSVQFEAIREFRKLLSIENPPIEEVIRSGVVPCFVQLLARDEFPQFQFEAAWTLTNIVSGTSENTMVVVNHGAMPIFVKLLSSTNEDVREQAVWALGNVSGDSVICRDIVLAHGALTPLLQLLSGHTKLSLLRIASWTLSNLCRGKPQPNREHVKLALPVLWQLIHSQDEEVISDACWALSYLTECSSDVIQAVIDAGACPRLVELLNHLSPLVISPALRVVGNIATGNDLQTQVIIDCQALPLLLNLLATCQKKSIIKEACWAISNITAGNKEQIQDVINGNIVDSLVRLMQTAEFDIRREAALAISNATSGGTADQITYLVSQGCIRAFCDLLGYTDTTILMVCLEGLENILKIGETEKQSGACDLNIYAQMIDDSEGLEKIENLQTHGNNSIYEMVAHLLETYWLDEDDAMPIGEDAPETGAHYRKPQFSVPLGEFNFG
ncbi:hypothetical protein ACP4OV_013362 [Aristida adscensionis]